MYIGKATYEKDDKIMNYNEARKKFEKKWQLEWEKSGIYEAKDESRPKAAGAARVKKYFAMFEFPYPSGAGMHVGHVRSQTAMDIITRKRRMEGFNVLYPIGWDAFGLPTENYAIKMGIDPAVATKQNTENFTRQLKAMGFGLDWSREIDTTDPNYYKWTQWMFLKFFEKGLAYKAKTFINWCPKDKIGLANEEAAGGVCDRCGGPVEKREKEQWMIRITDYADKLLEGLKTVDYIPQARTQQENWIGRSEGAEIDFPVVSEKVLDELVEKNHSTGTNRNAELEILKANQDSYRENFKLLKIFTTRPDTIFGSTYVVLSPEHQLINKFQPHITNWRDVEKYVENADRKTIEERNDDKEKTGIELKGIVAIHPVTHEELFVWVSDYVLSAYGTGAIMAVPAHDERDFEFAKKYKLPIFDVISEHPLQEPIIIEDSPDIIACAMDPFPPEKPFLGEGFLMHSGKFNGLDSEEAKKRITEAVGGKITVRYKLRDWVFSRQRYWGEPIPLVFCPACAKNKVEVPSSKHQEPSLGEKQNPGWFAMDEKDLPLKLPKVEKYQPTDTGESPLANITDWVNVKCPKCKGPAKRETDTMPNWAGSSWYYLGYVMSKNAFKKPVSLATWNLELENFRHFMPVDWYNGGMEHTVLHLLYSRFWNIFLYDLGLVPTSEPYKKRTSHGTVLAADGAKMSKSLGNVVNPDDIIAEFGADALRLYEMFMGPFNQAISWDPHGILGCSRFLERVWNVSNSVILNESEGSKKQDSSPVAQNDSVTRLVHKTLKKVGTDIESMAFNTAISAMMVLANALSDEKEIGRNEWEIFLKILAPFAPHMTEELWSELGNMKSIHIAPWPEFDPKLLIEDSFELVIQINGKIRDKVSVLMNINQAEVEKIVLVREETKKWLTATPKKVIFVKNRLINLII